MFRGRVAAAALCQPFPHKYPMSPMTWAQSCGNTTAATARLQYRFGPYVACPCTVKTYFRKYKNTKTSPGPQSQIHTRVHTHAKPPAYSSPHAAAGWARGSTFYGHLPEAEAEAVWVALVGVDPRGAVDGVLLGPAESHPI